MFDENGEVKKRRLSLVPPKVLRKSAPVSTGVRRSNRQSDSESHEELRSSSESIALVKII